MRVLWMDLLVKVLYFLIAFDKGIPPEALAHESLASGGQQDYVGVPASALPSRPWWPGDALAGIQQDKLFRQQRPTSTPSL
jgi:hypothetical protein